MWFQLDKNHIVFVVHSLYIGINPNARKDDRGRQQTCMAPNKQSGLGRYHFRRFILISALSVGMSKIKRDLKTLPSFHTLLSFPMTFIMYHELIVRDIWGEEGGAGLFFLPLVWVDHRIHDGILMSGF
jgi:hypothetical protein